MNNFPAMTEERRQLAALCKIEIKRWQAASESNPNMRYMVELMEIALAALTADTSKLAELAAKVRKVREDAADFDGDRRGMWEYQEEQEQLLLEEAVKYTAPPAPVLKPIELPGKGGVEATSEKSIRDWSDGWAACREEAIKAIRDAGYEVKS